MKDEQVIRSKAARKVLSGLPHQPDGLEPTEDLFDAFPFRLTHSVPGIARRAPSVDRARAPVGLVLGHTRRHSLRPQPGHSGLRVVQLVAAESDPLVTPGVAFGGAGLRCHLRDHGEPRAILHHEMPVKGELRFAAGFRR